MQSKAWVALREAFPRTVPILVGFWFVAVAYGIYMNSLGFPAWYSGFMAAFIFGGSLEFVAATMLLSPFAPVEVFLVALAVQARHLFYGVSMIERYGGTGWKKPFLMYWLCDETFAMNYAMTVPEGIDRPWFMFWVSFLNYAYWVVGALMGGLLGSMIIWNIEGISFVMTTLFVVIFLEQWLKEKDHTSSFLGGGISIASLILFGAGEFLLPAMVGILVALLALKVVLEKRVMS